MKILTVLVLATTLSGCANVSGGRYDGERVSRALMGISQGLQQIENNRRADWEASQRAARANRFTTCFQQGIYTYCN